MKYEKPTIIINKIETKDDVADLQVLSNVTTAELWSNLVKKTNVNYY